MNPPEVRVFPAAGSDRTDRGEQGKNSGAAQQDKWFGVTYREDKPLVVEAIARKTAEGQYPRKTVGVNASQ